MFFQLQYQWQSQCQYHHVIETAIEIGIDISRWPQVSRTVQLPTALIHRRTNLPKKEQAVKRIRQSQLLIAPDVDEGIINGDGFE